MTRSPIPPPKPKPVEERSPATILLLLLVALLLAGVLYSCGAMKKLNEIMDITPAASPPTPTPTATPTLGLQVAAPLSAFPDGGAFLTPGYPVSLSGYDGGMLVLTTEARVAAIITGTPPAVLLDVPKVDADKVQAVLANPTPGVLQYIPATVTHTPVPEPTTPATPEP